ncbi:LuxR C-terminal-related transcriptional regulator [Fodinicurvata sp. EGI_FJ10296]|uniref:helix-turn-helix transcriptional regulator n=1 Tax=Fodinicurvata sp. EGI_FJ10296 TaxID=3231908 RepID=UPI003453DC00
MDNETEPRLFLASRDPMIGGWFVHRLAAAGVKVSVEKHDWCTQGAEIPGAGDMIVLGQADIRRLMSKPGAATFDVRILLGVSALNIGSVLSALARLGRPRPGDAIVVLDNRNQPLGPVVAVATEGYLSLPAEILGPLVEEAAFRRLALTLEPDEARLLSLLARGFSNARIAEAVGWHQSQVKSRLRTLMRRLNVANRTAAAVAAFRLGLDTFPD